jgi:hypothetical protein
MAQQLRLLTGLEQLILRVAVACADDMGYDDEEPASCWGSPAVMQPVVDAVTSLKQLQSLDVGVRFIERDYSRPFPGGQFSEEQEAALRGHVAGACVATGGG